MAESTLYVCASPIGNLGDVSDRLRAVLGEVELVYAEDTRRAATLLSHVGSTAKARSLFAGNEKARSEEIIGHLESGVSVALITDAGTPAVSDPGAWVVSLAHARGLRVTVVPGPSAVTAALALSGFPADRFVFEGFLPRRGGERRERLDRLAQEPRTIVLFASPNRLPEDLRDLSDALGADRQVAVTREISKVYEEVWMGTLGESTARWGEPTRGEVTVVLGPTELPGSDLAEAIGLARRLVGEGMALSEAARDAASATGASRRTVYQALLDDQARNA